MTYNPNSNTLIGTSGTVPIYSNSGLQGTIVGISPSGQLNCTGRIGTIKTNTDAPIINFNMNFSDFHTVTLSGARTLTVSNDSIRQPFIISLVQDASGSRTVTWWSGIRWSNSTIPILTTTPAKEDIFTFIKYNVNDYRGFTGGLNF